jgi:peptide subunit release factor 1 (eRF1)
MAAAIDSNPTQLFEEQFQRLAALEPVPFPFISLYLNLQPDDRGRDHFQGFLRRELASRGRTFAAGSAEAESFRRDAERIEQYVAKEVQPAANGLAIFACAGADDYFEAVQLEAPIDEHRLYISDQPNLYQLARIGDEYPRYAALVSDANTARIFVFGLGQKIADEKVKGKKVQRVKVGGWSQARYQRRADNAQRDHAKEAIEALERIVREERIAHVILGGDPEMVHALKEALPKELAEKLVDVMRLDVKAPEREIFEATLETMREKDAVTDAEKAQRLLELYRAGGLAVTGIKETLQALENGQAEELLISASLDENGASEEVSAHLIAEAARTSARVSFIEDQNLLASVENVGAFLRWR